MATGNSKQVNDMEIEDDADTGSLNDMQLEDDGDNAGDKCSICRETFRRPKLLPCFHTFCERCLREKAGTSDSFRCPLCDRRVLVPAGGVKALKTNLYIKDDPPLCDMCEEDDKGASHFCRQCQHRLCLPCCQNHDSRTSTPGHTAVILTSREGHKEYGKEQESKQCVQHLGKQLSFYCSTCRVDICQTCKTTKHLDHKTKDFDLQKTLNDEMRALQSEMKYVDSMATAFDERCIKLEDQKKAVRQVCQDRATTLNQWANQCVNEVVQTFQDSSEQLSEPWRNNAQQLRNEERALDARSDYIQRILNCGNHDDFVSLEAQLSLDSGTDVDMETMKNEMSDKMPFIYFKSNLIAVTRAQVSAFIGVQEQQKHISLPLPQSIQGNVSNTLNAKQSLPTSAVPSAKLNVDIVEFINSNEPIIDMCLVSSGRLWLLTKRAGLENADSELKLFCANDAVTYTYGPSRRRLLSVKDDVLLSWEYDNRNVDLVFPDNQMTTQDMGEDFHNFHSFVSNDMSNVHYILTKPPVQLLKVEITPVVNVTTRKVTMTILETVSTSIPPNLRHVSPEGNYFACLSENERHVKVYSRTSESPDPSFIRCFQTTHGPTAARFFTIQGQTVLLVIAKGERKVHVFHFLEKESRTNWLDTEPLTTDIPVCLATDTNKHYWIGFEGGKLSMVRYKSQSTS